jgi:RNA polymerase sigma-70 factor (ECF subfamily)
LTEQELIYRLKAGDEIAFKHLVESRQSLVFNTVLGFLQSTEDAEDVTQDIFVKIFESILSGSGNQCFRIYSKKKEEKKVWLLESHFRRK